VILGALILALPAVEDFFGRVVDAQGKAVPNARVVMGEIGHATVYYIGAPDTTYVATPGVPNPERSKYATELTGDPQGRFVATGLVAGEYSLIATHAERGIALGTFLVGSSKASQTIELKSPAYLEAVITGLDRDPSVHLLQLKPVGVGSNLSILPLLVEQGKSWSFASTALPSVPGWRIVGTELVQAQDHPAVLFSHPLRLDPGQEGRVDLDLAGGRAITGTVSDAKGMPLSGVSVVARADQLDGRERGAVTDANGRYVIRGLFDGAYACEAARWTPPETRGCGGGFQDVFEKKEIAVPLAEGEVVDFRITATVPRPKVGDEATVFEAPTTDGGRIGLAGLRGKVVLLDFWATWCPMSRAEMSKLVEMYDERSKGGKFEIVGISLDEDVGHVPRFAASRGLKWPQTALGPEAKNPLARMYNAHSTPMTVLVDAEGKIAAVNLLGEELRKKIAEMLGAK